MFLGSLTVVCLDAYLADHFCLTGGQTDCEDHTCITITIFTTLIAMAARNMMHLTLLVNKVCIIIFHAYNIVKVILFHPINYSYTDFLTHKTLHFVTFYLDKYIFNNVA